LGKLSVVSFYTTGKKELEKSNTRYNFVAIAFILFAFSQYQPGSGSNFSANVNIYFVIATVF